MNLFLDAQQQQSPVFLIVLIVIMFAFIYFFQWRPNKKRQAEYKKLLESLEVGSEVLLNGGLLGTITKLRVEDDLVQVEIAKGVIITTKRGFVVQVLPNGTIESIVNDNKASKKASKGESEAVEGEKK
ncbi:preprotein translocase subunit YajC [Psittacicella melopsittaci]|uniref:Sec translocon accessory complex subunit YajC n=1 Tax=Psittacicella melopsittaci TaxID=2028576 RepID=A0A3A1Y7U6_9GAMM|nr:preprotein translocase subunit YajC [Psittacicella melopsittaci]RIY33288.1 preprotein translocase subunit YajC [Psittacicella melopsittaci]